MNYVYVVLIFTCSRGDKEEAFREIADGKVYLKKEDARQAAEKVSAVYSIPFAEVEEPIPDDALQWAMIDRYELVE